LAKVENLLLKILPQWSGRTKANDMLLQHYTWQQFLIAALLLSLIWYAALILAFYREKIDDFLNGRHKRPAHAQPVPHAWEEDYENEYTEQEEESLMGKTALPEGMSRVSMNMFGFAPLPENSEQAHAAFEENETAGKREPDEKDTRLGIIPDVLEELKSIFHILETEQGTKADFISLFTLVSSKYPTIKGTSNQQVLNEYIRENVLFPISDEELDSLWV
jgi:hypothetical protein